MSHDTIYLPLSATDREAASMLGVSYRSWLDERHGEANIMLEIFVGEDCHFEDSYHCMSFAGNHDLDAWDSALARAAQDFRQFLTELRDAA